MRIREFFTVPEGKRVTEKVFGRVLVSSVCGILLCMACLISTTWAWFTVSIENTGNMIRIGEPTAVLTVEGSVIGSGTELEPGSYQVEIKHGNERDDLQKKSPLYVTLLLDGETAMCVELNEENDYSAEVALERNSGFRLSWDVSWFPPASAVLLTDGQ